MAIHSEWIACRYCDSIYPQETLPKGCALYCKTCGSCIKRHGANLEKAAIYALTSLILFVIANTFPFVHLSMPGAENTISIFSSIDALFRGGLPILGVAVFLLIVWVPLWYVLGILWLALSFRLRFLHRYSQRFLFWMSHLMPWSMLEVYLVGIIVTTVKIQQLATLSFGVGFWAFVVLMLSSLLTNHHFDLGDETLQTLDEECDD